MTQKRPRDSGNRLLHMFDSGRIAWVWWKEIHCLAKNRNIVFSTMTNIKKARYFSSFTLIISYSRHKKCQVGYGQRAFQYLSSQRPLRILDIFDQTARKSCKKSLCGWKEKRTIKVEWTSLPSPQCLSRKRPYRIKEEPNIWPENQIIGHQQYKENQNI